MGPVRILAVSFAFPPLAYPRSIQVARILSHLDAEIVLFCAEEAEARHDHTIGRGVEAGLRACIRVPFNPCQLLRILWRGAHLLRVPIFGKIPDNYRSWIKRTYKQIISWLNQNHFHPNLIATFGQPMSDHIVGLEVKRSLGIPWVAFFSDPWVDNPYRNDDSVTAWINRRLERKVIAAVDRVVFTSDETSDLIMAKYPQCWGVKARVVPHSFDPEAYPKESSSLPHGNLRTIRYVGNFYGHRTPAPLIIALKRLFSTQPELLSNVHFELVGGCSPIMLHRAGIKSLPSGLISVKAPVSYEESLRLMVDSDALLLIDAPDKFNVFFPSKLADYIGAGHPILGITPPGSTAELILRLGGWVADPRRPEEIEAMLVNYLSLPPFCSPWGNPSVRREYEISEVAKRMKEIIKGVLKKEK